MLALLCCAYALAGFLLVPTLLQSVVLPRLAQSTGGHFQVKTLHFDPFQFALSARGFALADPQGTVIAEAESLAVNLNLSASLKRHALVASGLLVKPSLKLAMTRQNTSNFDFLLSQGPPPETDGQTFPFLLESLKIIDGRGVFEEASRGKGLKKVFTAVNLAAEDLGPLAEAPGHFSMSLDSEEQEAVQAEGRWQWQAMRLEGSVALRQIALPPLAAWLDAGPVALASGKLSGDLKLGYDSESGLNVQAGGLALDHLSLNDHDQPRLVMGTLELRGLSYQGKDGKVAIQTLGTNQLEIKGPTALQATGLKAENLSFQAPLLAVEHWSVQALQMDPTIKLQLGPVSAHTLSLDTQTQKLGVGGLEIDTLKLDQTIRLQAAKTRVEALGFMLGEKTLSWKTLAVEQFEVGRDSQIWASIARLAADDLAYDLKQDLLKLTQLGVNGVEFKTPSPIVDKEGKNRQYRVDSASAYSLTLDLPKKNLKAGRLQTTGADLAVWLERDGDLGVSGLPEFEDPPPRGRNDTSKKSPAWRVQFGELALKDNKLLLRDFNVTPPASLRLVNLNLLVKDFDSAAGKPFWLGVNAVQGANGRLSLEGKITSSPLSASMKLVADNFNLLPLQAYLDRRVRLILLKGGLNLDLDVDYEDAPEHKLRLGGDLEITDFDSDDKIENRDFIHWKSLRLNGLIFDTVPKRLSIREVALHHPYARVFINPEKKLNIAEILSPPEASASPAIEPASLPAPRPAEPRPVRNKQSPKQPVASTPPPTAQPVEQQALAVTIGKLRIQNGEMDFTDMTLKPNIFTLAIKELNGDIHSLSSRQDSKSDVLLQGRLNEGSDVGITGKINLLSLRTYTDLAMRCKGVNLSTLSPYAGKFAGYRIEKGKLSMDLRYRLNDGALEADNQFTLDHLELGEPVDSPEATSLPIRLAIALLKDGDGMIDINLPISGDLRDPEVSVAGLLGSAASNLLTKLIASPIAVLGGWMKEGRETTEGVVFAAGAAELSAQEKSKLEAVAKVLRERPALNLEIKGMAHEVLDRPALAEQDLLRQLKNARQIEAGRSKKSAWDGETLSAEDYARLLTNLYRWKNPTAPEWQTLKPGATLSPPELEKARRQLLANWQVNETDLRRLARERSEAVQDYLVKHLGIPKERLYLLDVKLGKPEDKDILTQLSFNGS